jgi:feruloyl esterase
MIGLVMLLAAAQLLLNASGPASAGLRSMLPAAGSQVPAPIMPVTSCSSLIKMNFTTVPDAPGKVTSATTATDVVWGKPRSFCDVAGFFAPRTHFKFKLPTASWHGQYVQEGCQIFCGQVPLSSYPVAGLTCTPVDNGELALGADDEGHTGILTDGSWAKNSLALRVVFGVTSEHSLDQMSRAVITAYYGRPASFTYYDGCSTGGREALMLAQRYPRDFNGIVVGAPASNLAPLALFNAWMVRSNTAPDGHQILTTAQIPALHAAVVRTCGNAQAIIADPRRCGFDPASIQCPGGRPADTCLTQAQVQAVRKFYRGPTDTRGRSLFNGGQPYGSELGWTDYFVKPVADMAAPGDTTDAAMALNYLKYMAFAPDPPDSFSLADVSFSDTEFRKLNLLGGAIYNASNPDLQAFAAHGGKLILYHGWADQAISPWSTLDYYAAVERSAGGFRASQAFSRLYMIPGAYHCLAAPDQNINTANFLTPLITWVQDGIGPSAVPANTSSPTGQVTSRETVRPYNALTPVTPAEGSLNGHYDYIGTYP